MSAISHPLTLQVQELFIDSGLPPAATRLLLDELNGYFVNNTLAYSDNLPSVVSALYAIGDDNMYSVVSVCGFNGYEAVLMPTFTDIIKASSKKTITFLKDSGKYEGHSLHAEISKLNFLMKSVLELLRNSTRTTRRAIGVVEKDIDFPDYETLKVFYECGRKVSYESISEGEANLFEENNVYLCIHCNKYHQGRFKASNAPVVAEEVILGRYKTAWRRYNKI